MTKTTEEYLDICRNAVLDGESYDDIKREVLSWKLEKDQQKRILMKADDYVFQYNMNKQDKEKSVNRMLIGAVLLAAGFVIILVSSFSQPIEYALPLGATFIGGWQLKEGYKSFRKPLEITEQSNFPKGRNRFDRF